MTPKEKANKLCMRFLIQTTTDIPYGVNKTIAKECALIAVDELIYFGNNELLSEMFEGDYYCDVDFFTEVKQEIEKL
jgi:hypothetical protein